MVVLKGKNARRFERMIEEGLKHPVGPVPTPKLEQAHKMIMEDLKKIVACPKCGTDCQLKPQTIKVLVAKAEEKIDTVKVTCAKCKAETIFLDIFFEGNLIQLVPTEELSGKKVVSV